MFQITNQYLILWRESPEMPFFHRRQGGAASYFYHIKS